MLLTFARQSAGTPETLEYSGERLLNWYPRPWPDGGRGAVALLPSPGLTRHVLLSSGRPVRAIVTANGGVFAVCGGHLWRVVGSTVTAVGSIVDTPDTTIAADGVNVSVAAGGEYYVWNGTTLSTPSSGAFDQVGSVTEIDGYTVLSELGGQKFSVSGIRDAASIDALDFASAEGSPDHLVRVFADHSELILFGTRSTEIWQNSGNPDFPFTRLAGGKLNRGCLFPRSVVSEDNSVWWVGDDRVIYRMVGYTPTRVSTHAVERALRDYSETADIRAMTLTYDGAKWFVLWFPDRPAWVFDAASGMWHERGTNGPWLATCAASGDGLTTLGGSDGWLYRLGGLTDGPHAILREAVSLPVVAPDRLSMHEVEVCFRTGAEDINRPALASLEISRDGGRTWGPERWRSMGRLGNYDRRTRWQQLGHGRTFQARVRVTDPVSASIWGVQVRAS